MSSRYSNISEVPIALAVFLANDSYDHNDDPNTISATSLLKPLRQLILATRVPPGEGLVPLADMMKSRIGTAIHDRIEQSWIKDYQQAFKALGYPDKVINRIRINPTTTEEDTIPIYLEQRIQKKIGKWTISGKFDFVSEGKVQDFKTTSTFTYLKQTNSEKYSQQGSIYRWLNPTIITEPVMEIHYIFTDWKSSQAKIDTAYPQRQFLTQSFDLMTLRETEVFITRKLAAIEQYMEADEDQIPLCTDDELWRSEPVFKYYKNPTKLARSTKNFDNRQDAYLRLAEDGNVGLVKEVPGQVTACKYCPAFAACSQKDQLVASGDLVL